jgi:hypothetical protein
MPKQSKSKLRRNLINTLLTDIPAVEIKSQPAGKNMYLSFDVATKSIAFCIMKTPENLASKYIALKGRQQRLATQISEFQQLLTTKTCTTDELLSIDSEITQISEEITSMKQELKEFIIILDASVNNLIPDKKDKDISEVERIKAVVKYYKETLCPVLQNNQLSADNLVVLIEHQMAPNARARAVCSALVALFADYEVHIVKPIYKNRINLSNDSHWINFVKQYKTLYTANKKHAIHNFETLSAEFTCALTFKKTQISHVSDAFMQVLGYLKFKK